MKQEGESKNLISDGESLIVKGSGELAHWSGDIIEINSGIAFYELEREEKGMDWILQLIYEMGKANLSYPRFCVLYPSEGTIKPWIKIYKTPSEFIEELSVKVKILSGLNKMLIRDNEGLKNRGIIRIINKIKSFFGG